MIIYTYRVTAVPEGYLAHCLETGREATGAGRSEAIEALRAALVDDASHDEAVAPPEATPARPTIVLREQDEPDVGPFGPGDPR